MRITIIEGTAKEIATLVVETQERQNIKFDSEAMIQSLTKAFDSTE